MTKAEFMKTVVPVIKRVAENNGYGKFYKAISAQAACESNWGKSSLASKWFNFFGMKAGTSWTGKVAELKTKEEYTKGQLTTITAKFRAYNSLEEGIQGYFNFIERNKRYNNLIKATDDLDYITKLKADGWATSSTYVTTLSNILKGMKFDESVSVAVPVVQPSVSDGDELYRVAQDVIKGKYGNGSVRRLKLQQAGYDYQTIQNMVNKILRGA